MKSEKCNKCGNRHKRLTKKKLCFCCDPINWRNEYKTSDNKKRK